jgi:hypothetical protein
VNKVCSKCKVEKPLCEFLKKSDMKDGRHSYCNPCLKIWRQDWYQNNKKFNLDRGTKWRKNNPEKSRLHNLESGKLWRERNPEKYKLCELKKYEKRKLILAADRFEKFNPEVENH